jgi:hypothetical protein
MEVDQIGTTLWEVSQALEREEAANRGARLGPRTGARPALEEPVRELEEEANGYLNMVMKHRAHR